MLKDCFEATGWELFCEAAEGDIDFHVISKFTHEITMPTALVIQWLTRSPDMTSRKPSGMLRGTSVESHYQSSDLWHMWSGLHRVKKGAITAIGKPQIKDFDYIVITSLVYTHSSSPNTILPIFI